VGDDRFPGDVFYLHLPPLRQLMRRRYQKHELVGPDRHHQQAFFRRVERQRTEIEAALLDFDGDLARRDSTDVDGDVGIPLRKRAINGGRGYGRPPRWRRSGNPPRGEDQAARGPLDSVSSASRTSRWPYSAGMRPRLGERPALRGPVKLLAELDLRAADRLADGRLGAVHFGGGARKTALVGDSEEDAKGAEVHNSALF
jgi:hypothetical protein